MNILVLSDSHSALSFMRLCIDSVNPDVVIHLGDYVSDGEAMAEEYPGVCFYQVAGNCDAHRVIPGFPETLVENFEGCKVYFTHGHIQKVKTYLDFLLMDARRCGAQIALYGHTHNADCHLEEDGLWVMNPGSCGYYGGSAGFIEIVDRQVSTCRILKQSDLEEWT